MKFQNTKKKRIISCILVVVIVGGLLPNGLLSSFFGLFTPLFVNAESGYTAPEYEYMNQLYDASDAISPLPTYEEYKTQTGYTEPKRISLTDFRTKVGEGLSFNNNSAKSYMSQGYKLMICDSQELYLYSQIVNNKGSSPTEATFYLSANIVLGDNIEYTEMSYSEKYFLPIGSDSNPFIGTFDGQEFEIRDLYFDTEYTAVTVGFFGVVGKGAVIKNFGIYHPTIDSTNSAATFTAVIASRNYGTIDDVYTIVQEIQPEANAIANTNVIKSANSTAGGLVARNYESGTITDSYFAGMLDAHSPVVQNPICPINSGTISNCYYDKELFAVGTTPNQIDNPDNENIIGLSNIGLKKMNGMTNTEFKLVSNYQTTRTNTSNSYWQYPRLYGFLGEGTENNPFLISTPAQLIQFPNSVEYSQMYYFKIDKCIDMNEVAPNVYKPNLDITFTTNYKYGNRWVVSNYTLKNRSFFGKLIGTADDGDDNCPIHHTASLGNDSTGNKLRETHIILNLTIDTPATSTNSKDKRYSALIAQSTNNQNIQYNAGVKDLSFIGGEISSGDTDCMPSTNTDSSYNVISATVVANSSSIDMENVHSSATVKLGTGLQRSVSIGGLVGGGNLHYITDCTNSGEIIGGALNMASENITTYNVRIGGLLGNGYISTNTNWSIYGRLTHVANYGNVYGAYIVTDEENDWKLTGGAFYASGITTNQAGSGSNGNTTTNGSKPNIYISDSNRMSKVANFGNIYDVPVVKDEVTGEVVYENGKPIAETLSSGKKIVNNYSYVRSRLYGIGYNIISNAYNEGNFYSVAVNKCEISGIGYMNTNRNASNGQYYNFRNYNKGNIYMYVGGIDAFGIATGYAYYSYNCGNIYLYDGTIFSEQNDNRGIDNGGAFAGICGMDTLYSYNSGDIYIAPSARHRFNSTTTSTVSNAYVLITSGSIRYSSNFINAGKITLDLDKNNFDPTYTTSSTTDTNHFPFFGIGGAGIGSYNSSYGEYNVIPNKQDNNKMTRISIAGCCRVTPGNNWSTNTNYNRNYSDITVDTSKAPNSIYSLNITGIGYNHTQDENAQNSNRFTFNNNINYGNFTVKGQYTGNVTINTLGYQVLLATDNLNLGDVTIDKDCVIKGQLNIRCYYTHNNTTARKPTIKNMVNGWYDGCELPKSMQTSEWNNEVFSKLDKSRRYGKITVSGTVSNIVYITGVLDAASSLQTNAGYIENIINNGEITITDFEIINSTINVRGVGLPYCIKSKNYAPITVKNIYQNYNNSNYSTNIYGCAGGENNINYAPITVENCVTNVVRNSSNLYIAGIANNYTSSHCENRGDITVKNLDTATVHGTVYTSTALTGGSGYDSIVQVAGIRNLAGKVEYCINYGDINVERVGRHYIGGVTSNFNNSIYVINNCINYGDININESGGESYVGGIAARIVPSNVSHCYNFANIKITNPTSYINTGDYIGGIVGHITGVGSTITQSENFGNIYYNNDKPYNTNNTKDNTKASTMFIGGVVGLAYEHTINCVLNYGSIEIGTERNRNNIRVGGITGGSSRWGNAKIHKNYNMVNYGDITVEYIERGGLYAGGIVGVPYPNNSQNGGPTYTNGINYGTVQYKGDNKDKNYVGSLVGYNDNNTPPYLDKLVDLSDPPEGVTDYPIIGGYANTTSVNATDLTLYSKNEATVNSHDQSRGTLKLVTLDKDETTGLYNTSFPFRNEIIHELTEYKTYQENGMVYQDYANLSPYLQAYMKMRFGSEAENYGAYVVMDKSISEPRDVDEFMPRRLKISAPYNNTHFGVQWDEDTSETSSCFDSSLVNDNELNPLYSTMVSPSERTLQKDFDIYAQQIKESSLAEILEYNMETKWQYTNNETTHFQFFNEYISEIETHAATLSDGTVSDIIQYTDINVYMSIDDINSYIAQAKVRDPETGKPITETDDNGITNIAYETLDTEGYLYISSDIELMSNYANMIFYQGDTMNTTERLEEINHYTDPYPKGDDIWLTADNLEEMLADEEIGWSSSLNSVGANKTLNDTQEDIAYRDMWEIKIPYQSESDLSNMYTKVLGVITAEDGIHKNIVVVHVVIDRYKPYATLDSVTLNTTTDGLVTSTVDNGGLEIDPNMKDSLTDKDKNDTEKPAQDVTYYSLSDNYKKSDGSSLSGENIQTYKVYASSSTNNNYPMINVTTHNMDEEGAIWARVLWQDRIPSIEETTYNELEWNYEAQHYKETYKTNPVDIVFFDDQTSIGKATISLEGLKRDSTAFYGGLYRIDLYYERTKSSGSSKHFATIFLCKEHSPLNSISSAANSSNWGIWHANPATFTANTLKNLSLQTTYDTNYGLSDDGYQQGHLLNARPNYNINPLTYFYRTQEENDNTRNTSNANNHGSYMSLKSYSSANPTSTYYIDKDNPIYNDYDEETEKGKAVTLENEVEKIYVKSDSETGAYYPIKYLGHTDIMAENGDIRRYTYEQSHTGAMGENDSWITYSNDPKITISSATKNGFSIVKKDENNSYIGEILGKDESNTTFYVKWASSNVTNMARTDNNIYSDEKYAGSGYASNRIKIYFKDISSDDYIELTSEQISEYFTTISVGTSNDWTFILQNDSPVGTYKVIPYYQYRMDFTNKTVNDDLIKLYDYDTKEYLDGKDALNFTWTIPYSVPFIINNIPNDESYITEFNVNNQQYTPFIVEESDIEGSDSREATILNASENGTIVYKGYDDVMTGDNRVDTFTIYSYVKKDSQSSKITMRVPYKATIQKYTGTVSGDDSYPSFDDSLWENADAEEILVYDEEGNIITNNYKQYSFSITYNEYNDDINDYTYSPSVTYYKAIAEDGKTETIYKVYVVPGVRNKNTTLEIAQSNEIGSFGGEDSFKQEMTELFEESDKLYQEILEKYGTISATIKELNGSEVDAYQSKYFNDSTSGESQPYVYNLKSFAYDISIDLPAGYTYDVLVFSQNMDNADTLKNSQNGFDGKQLILSSSSKQDLNIRIVIKRDTAMTIWGVQYIWNMSNAVKDDNSLAILGQGGTFSNYVYTLPENS